jgi:hypothetical protein
VPRGGRAYLRHRRQLHVRQNNIPEATIRTWVISPSDNPQKIQDWKNISPLSK